MREIAERSYYLLCLGLGQLLRSARYSKTRIVHEGGEPQVRKHRVFFAPFLIWMGNLLLRILDTGVRVLPQREWEEREREIYQNLHGERIEIAPDGTLVLPGRSGEALATLLEHPELEESVRRRAIDLAVASLADLHRAGLTHGDAMAENVLVDLEAGIVHWVDFETVHDARRPMAWRRGDDLRALLATCLVRTDPEQVPATLHLVLDTYDDESVTGDVASSFAAIWRRSLTFHLAQAGLSHRRHRQVAGLLRARRLGK